MNHPRDTHGNIISQMQVVISKVDGNFYVVESIDPSREDCICCRNGSIVSYHAPSKLLCLKNDQDFWDNY